MTDAVQVLEHPLSASHILLDQEMMPQLSLHISWTCNSSQTSGQPHEKAGEGAVLNSLGLIMLQLLTGRYHPLLQHESMSCHCVAVASQPTCTAFQHKLWSCYSKPN